MLPVLATRQTLAALCSKSAVPLLFDSTDQTRALMRKIPAVGFDDQLNAASPGGVEGG